MDGGRANLSIDTGGLRSHARRPEGHSHTISFSSNDQNNQMIALVATGRLTLQLPQSTVTARPNSRVELPIRIQRSPEIAGPVTLELMASTKPIWPVSSASPITIEKPGNSTGTLGPGIRYRIERNQPSPADNSRHDAR